jgi:hypothetical protein
MLKKKKKKTEVKQKSEHNSAESKAILAGLPYLFHSRITTDTSVYSIGV